MASSSRARFTAWAVAAVLLPAVLMVSTRAAVSCGDAVNALIPCGSYLVGSGQAEPSPQCCKSARELNQMATTVAERRALCQCFKQTGPSFGVKPKQANHLLSACNLKLTIPLSPNVDCSRI